MHTVVMQIERCEVALLIGYAAGSGDPTERIIARAASQPPGRALDALRETLAAYAMAPFAITLDGAALAPTGIQAKIGLDGGGTRPVIVVLATFALPRGGQLAVASRDPRTTRISWHDRDSARIALDAAPAQNRWFSGVASFLLPLVPAGGSTCATSGSSHSPPR